MQIEQKFFVGVEDVDETNLLNDKGILDTFSNMANLHGLAVGQSTGDINVNNMAWVVLQWKAIIYKRPKVCEEYNALTWPQEYNRVSAIRNFELRDLNNELLVSASSRWTAIKIDTRAIVRLTPELMEGYGLEPDKKVFEETTFTNLHNIEVPISNTKSVPILKGMIDCFGHVHNPSYLDLAKEVLPDGFNCSLVKEFEVSYRKEIMPGLIVKVSYGKQDNNHYVFIHDETNEILHAVIMLKE